MVCYKSTKYLATTDKRSKMHKKNPGKPTRGFEVSLISLLLNMKTDNLLIAGYFDQLFAEMTESRLTNCV
jgi:hypothetical protein